MCEEIEQSAAGMERIMVKANSLENVRIKTVGIVENSASMEEVMASIEDIFNRLGGISAAMSFNHTLYTKFCKNKTNIKVI